MGTETFTAFKSDGTAYKLKGRILRHLDNDPVTDADKSNIRTTLGITSQGGLGDLLAANNLDDVASTSTAMENLKIPSVGSGSHQISLNGQLGTLAFQDADGATLSTLKLTDLPTSASGLASGSVWNDSGTLKIVS
ncbi:MAG: hypothetical protein ACO23H_20490 [Alphaproteobacteria bacterium]